MASPHPSQAGGRLFRFGQFELSEREGGERRANAVQVEIQTGGLGSRISRIAMTDFYCHVI